MQSAILVAALRAPIGGNSQNWRFLLVEPRRQGPRRSALPRRLAHLFASVYSDLLSAAAADPDDPDSYPVVKVQRSAQWLADHFEDVPLFLFGFAQHDPTGGSIYPAVWSAMLAARAHGVGSSLTSVLGFFHPRETLDILGVPDGEGWIMACCVSFGYPTGRWGVAGRRPVARVSYRNRWGLGSASEVPAPLWTPGEGA